MNNISFSRNMRMGLTGIFALFIISASDAQPQKTADELKQQIEKSRRDMDSLAQKNARMLQEMTDSINGAAVRQMGERSYEWLNQYEQEKKKKQKQKAIMYLAFGAAGLAVLAFGLLRKRKQKVS